MRGCKLQRAPIIPMQLGECRHCRLIGSVEQGPSTPNLIQLMANSRRSHDKTGMMPLDHRRRKRLAGRVAQLRAHFVMALRITQAVMDSLRPRSTKYEAQSESRCVLFVRSPSLTPPPLNMTCSLSLAGAGWCFASASL
jgi:hypothetical protein